MATTTPIIAIPSSREVAMTYLWDKIFDYFEAEEYQKAECTLLHFTRLEEMSDGEYLRACHCVEEGCHCNL